MTTLWAGPVSLAVAKRAAVGDITLVQCTGDGAPTCGQQAASFSGGPFTALCAFSAGGSFLKRRRDLLESAQVLYLADATYTTTNGEQEAPFAEYAARAAAGGPLFVATASSFANKTHPNGEQTLRMIQERAGIDSDHVGNAHFFYKGAEIPHASHATLFAPELWGEIVLPFLSGAPVAGGGGPDAALPFSSCSERPEPRTTSPGNSGRDGE